MTAKAKGLDIGVLAIGGLALWALTRKPAIGQQPAAIQPLKAVVQPPVPKQPLTEPPSIPLETWQKATSTQLANLPVNTTKRVLIGPETYNPTSKPIAISNTGFKIWGTTESGATVVSKNDPSTYPAWEWY